MWFRQTRAELFQQLPFDKEFPLSSRIQVVDKLLYWTTLALCLEVITAI